MARDHTRVGTDLWTEPSIRKLKVRQQRAYFLALTQPDLSRCGVVAYRLRRWASFATDDNTAALRKDFDALTRSRHVVVDEDHEELFVRTYIRHDRILAQPLVVAALVADYKQIASPVVRRALLAELRRLWDEDLSAAERGGWLLTFGHYPTEVANDQQATWPFSMKQVALIKLRKAVGTGLRDAMHTALDQDSPDPLPPFDPLSEHGIPAGFGGPSRQGSQEGSPEPSAKGSDKGSPRPTGDTRAHPRSPSPTPTPSPTPATSGGAALAPLAEPHTAQQLIAEWIEHTPKRPPTAVIGQVGKQLTALLADDQDVDDVRAGLAVWASKGLHPSTLPSVVHEVTTSRHRTRTRPSTSEAAAQAALDAGARVAARRAQASA